MILSGSPHSYLLITGKYFKSNQPMFFVHCDISFLWYGNSTVTLGEDSGCNNFLPTCQLIESWDSR